MFDFSIMCCLKIKIITLLFAYLVGRYSDSIFMVIYLEKHWLGNSF